MGEGPHALRYADPSSDSGARWKPRRLLPPALIAGAMLFAFQYVFVDLAGGVLCSYQHADIPFSKPARFVFHIGLFYFKGGWILIPALAAAGYGAWAIKGPPRQLECKGTLRFVVLLLVGFALLSMAVLHFEYYFRSERVKSDWIAKPGE